MNLIQLTNVVSAALGFENAEPLTTGGQKHVLKGTLSGAPAVAKIILLPTQGPNRDVTLQRARREVELLSTVDSDHVVKVLTDAIELDDPAAVCWVEEFLDGADLSDSLDHVWAEPEVWSFLDDMSAALAACHELEVVHRDLSPANVRCTPDGHFVLMDPGLARHLEKTALTGAFQPGTTGWRSPEHVPGGNPIPASDIYCLGILAFYALSGAFPVDPSGDPSEYDRALVESQTPSVSTLAPEISRQLAEVVDTCLSRQAARRYLDGEELAAAVRHLRSTE